METVIAQIGTAFQPKDIISEAIYCNYRFNRMNNSTITPKQWERVFGDTTQMEERLQNELKQ